MQLYQRIEKKQSHFAYCGFDDMLWSRQHGEGFCDRIKEAGLETSLYVQPKSNRSWEKEQSFAVEWLGLLPKAVALMMCNDNRGQYVMEVCKIVDLHVPDESAIIGVDNDELIYGLIDLLCLAFHSMPKLPVSEGLQVFSCMQENT